MTQHRLPNQLQPYQRRYSCLDIILAASALKTTHARHASIVSFLYITLHIKASLGKNATHAKEKQGSKQDSTPQQ